MKTENYLHLYLGSETNHGVLVGILQHSYLLSRNGEIIERSISTGGEPLKLLLKKINNLTAEQSAELNRKGLSIGRPGGYSFTPDALLYLLSLSVDVFNLIGQGLAIDINDVKDNQRTNL